MIDLERSISKPYLIKQLENFEKNVLADSLAKPDGTTYIRHRYRKLSETFMWVADWQYYVGNIVIYNNGIYIANNDNISSVWNDGDWTLVGETSDIHIVDSIPNPATLVKNELFVLLDDETDASGIVHKKGIYLYDFATQTYSIYREYEEKDLDFSEIWDSTKVSAYQGSDEQTVNSKYLYNQIKTFGDKVADEIRDIYDIAGNPKYIVTENYNELINYDLSSLEDNSINIFMVKTDDKIKEYVNNSDPTDIISVADYENLSDDDKKLYSPVYAYLIPGCVDEYYSNIYICLCDDDGSDRVLTYVGHLCYGEHGLTTMIQEMIDSEIRDPQTNEYKFLEKVDYDTDTLKNVSHNKVVDQDEGTTTDYLTFKGEALMYNKFEEDPIVFVKSEY